MFIWILRNPINVRQIELLIICLYSEGSEDRLVVVQHFWCRKTGQIVCRVSRKWMQSKFLDQDVDVVSLANKCIVIGCFVSRNYNKILMETEKLKDNIRVTKNGLGSGVDRMFKVIRHVFGFGIEFLENKDIGIFGHSTVIDFMKRYSYHTYLSPISTSWFRRCGTGCIVRNVEWRKFVNYSVFSALFPLKLRVIYEEGILGTPVQKDVVPPIFISNYHRKKKQFHYNPFVYWVIFVYLSLKYCLKHRSSRFNTILKEDVYQIIQSHWFCVHIIVQGVRGCVKIKSMNLTNIQREVTFVPHIWHIVRFCVLPVTDRLHLFGKSVELYIFFLGPLPGIRFTCIHDNIKVLVPWKWEIPWISGLCVKYL